MSDTCVCPKECDILQYTASMSNAPANQDNEDPYDLSKIFLERTGKQLNDSLDIMERLLPDRRENNKADFELLHTHYGNKEFLLINFKLLTDQLRDLSALELKLVTDFPISCDIGMLDELKTMEDVLRKNVVVVWDEMGLSECVRDSLELSRTITQYTDRGFKESWLAVILIRLEEKSIASNIALHNLGRMHHTYANATLNGSYESFYLTSALFNQATDELEVYSRLVGHLKRYIGCIEGLIRIYVDVGHNVSKYKGELINHINGLLPASVEYVKLLDTYESLVIRQPLQRITKAKNIFEYYKSLPDVYAAERSTNINVLRSDLIELSKIILKMYMTEVSDAIADYVYNLREQRLVSKINITNIITSNRIPQLLEETEIVESTCKEDIKHYKILLEYFNMWTCLCIAAAKTEPLLLSFYTKVLNHYRTTATSSDRAAMRRHFRFLNYDHPTWHMLLGDGKCPKIIDDNEFVRFAMNNYIDMSSLRHVNSIMKRLHPFLEKTRLDGSFLRYFNHCTFERIVLPPAVSHPQSQTVKDTRAHKSTHANTQICKHANTHSRAHTHVHTHARTHARAHTPTMSLPSRLTTLPHSLTYSRCHSLNQTHSHSLTQTATTQSPIH